MTTAMSVIDQLEPMVGEELGTGSWTPVTQEAINAFAEVTGDRQWIHTDPVRAAASPLGGTIAHGYYTLALVPATLGAVLDLDAFPMAINYGLDAVRFPAPLPVGSRVRGRVTLERVERKTDGAMFTLSVQFETESAPKPVCVARCLVRTFHDAD